MVATLQDFAPSFGFKNGETLQGTDFPAIDFTLLARGQGVESVTVSDPAQLAAVLVEVDVA